MTAFKMGLISLYKRELSAEKEKSNQNKNLIEVLSSLINELQ